MKLLKTSISAFFTTVTVISGALVIGHASIAGSNGSSVDPSMPKVLVVNKAITESDVLAAQSAWGEALVELFQQPMREGVEKPPRPWQRK